MSEANKQQIESVVDQMDHFGDDEAAFDAYMAIVTPLIRLYADVGKFRSIARSQWLSGNKPGVKKLILAATDGPTLDEQEKELQAELLKAKAALEGLAQFQVATFFASVGFRKGDILTVQGSDGKQRNLVLDINLPGLGEDLDGWVKKNTPEEVRAQLKKMGLWDGDRE
jgi:hypothetical protein